MNGGFTDSALGVNEFERGVSEGDRSELMSMFVRKKGDPTTERSTQVVIVSSPILLNDLSVSSVIDVGAMEMDLSVGPRTV